MVSQPWQSVVQKKQDEVSAKFPTSWRLPSQYTQSVSENARNNVLDVPRQCGLLSPRQLEITENYDATALLGMIHAGTLTSYEVTEAFCLRAAIAQQVTRCLTETMFDRALMQAKHLDYILAKTGEPVGPLHGLPISLKDCFNIKGVPATIGFTSFIDHGPAESNSALVQILLNLGAVIYVKTNLPQTIMAADSHNYVFGRTLNPHRSNLTAGGSSGGEGALIAMRGSVLGIGTDVAGSIRIPAICNGIYAVRPSANRIPYGGQVGSCREGLESIQPCAGPLATSTRDLRHLMRCVLNTDPWELDSSVIFSPWRNITPKPSLRLGFVLEDSHFPLHPPVLRTLTAATEKLKAAGHEIIPLNVPSIKDACLLGFRCFAMDPANTPFQHISASGEPVIPALGSTKLPHEYMPYEYAPLTLEALYDLTEQRTWYKERLRELVVKNRVDAIIMPGNQGTAAPHDQYGWTPYTIFWNVMDYPASIIPLGKADKDADAPFVRDVVYRPSYDADAVDGAPCCVQLVGRNMREEELLDMTETVSNVLTR